MVKLLNIIYLTDFVAWLLSRGAAIAGSFKNQATLTNIGIPS
jgi:hypothetical protein